MPARHALWAALGLSTLIGGTLAPAAHAAQTPVAEGSIVWTRSDRPIPLLPVGALYAPDATQDTHQSDMTGAVSPVPAPGADTSMENEERLARQSGQTYGSDGTGTAAQPKFRMSGGIIDFAACNRNASGHTLTGIVIDHFNFCRWGYNTVTKLDGKGRVEGQVRFLETEVGDGSNFERTAGINIKTTEVTASGIYDGGAELTLSPSTTNRCTVQMVNPDGGSCSDPVPAWEGKVVRYEVTSPESTGDPTRIDKVAVCQSRSHYRVDSPRATPPGVRTPRRDTGSTRPPT